MKSALKRLGAIEKVLGSLPAKPVGPPLHLDETECRVLALVQAQLEDAPGEEVVLSADENAVLDRIMARMEEGSENGEQT